MGITESGVAVAGSAATAGVDVALGDIMPANTAGTAWLAPATAIPIVANATNKPISKPPKLE